MVFRKRVFASAFPNGLSSRTKRGRFIRRRRTKRGRNSVSYSTKNQFGSSLGFRSKRLSRRAWNKKLWDSTLQKAHWRSNGSLSGTITSTAGQAQLTIGTQGAMDNGIASFWTATGGTVEINDNQGVPVFGDDIVIRGGFVGIKIFNESTTIPLQIKIYLIKSAPRRTLSNLPAAAPFGWDPTIVPEFSRDIGRIMFRREFQLEPLAEMTTERRISIMKIDQEAWATDVQRLEWIITVGDPQTVVTATTRIATYWNISFAADSIGVT